MHIYIYIIYIHPPFFCQVNSPVFLVWNPNLAAKLWIKLTSVPGWITCFRGQNLVKPQFSLKKHDEIHHVPSKTWFKPSCSMENMVETPIFLRKIPHLLRMQPPPPWQDARHQWTSPRLPVAARGRHPMFPPTSPCWASESCGVTRVDYNPTHKTWFNNIL